MSSADICESQDRREVCAHAWFLSGEMGALVDVQAESASQRRGRV